MPEISSEPLRILHAVRAPVGGIIRHILDVANGQIERGHHVGIITVSLTGGARADALLADACFVDASQTGPHLNVKEACQLARDARVKTLYLTHLWGKHDTEESVKKEIDFSSTFVVKERGRYSI